MTTTETAGLLFTDIEGSTRLLQQLGPAYVGALLEHRELLRAAFAAHRGKEQGAEGDSFFVRFPAAPDAVAAALHGQRALASHAWPGDTELRVRMGVHVGEVRTVAGMVVGMPVHEAARIGSAAHGGQVLVSALAAGMPGALPAEAEWLDLGHHRLKDVGEMQLFQLSHADLRASFPPPRSQGSSRNNLPGQASAFIGREAEVREIGSLLRSSRLVTVTGAGGVGKSRVALRAAAEEEARFPDGTWFVDLAPAMAPDAVAPHVAAALGQPVDEAGDLASAIGARTLLLVVDNCEHLIDAVCDVIDNLLRRCAGVSVLATSRESLGMNGEVAWRLPSLGQEDAVELFRTRARAVNSQFEITDDNRDAVLDVCRRLDAMPLALELAAARLASLSVEQLASRLDQRFRLLSSGARDAMARQRTLQATVDWSYDLLEPDEKTTLCRLGVFLGGFTLEGAEAICPAPGVDEADVLDLVGRLVAKSLVVAEQRDAFVRYHLLETIRQYALDRLAQSGDVAAARDTHLAWVEKLALEAEPALWSGTAQAQWFARLDAEVGNLRSAFDHALERGRLSTATSIIWAVQPWLKATRHEGPEWNERLLAAGGTDEDRAMLVFQRFLLGTYTRLAHPGGDDGDRTGHQRSDHTGVEALRKAVALLPRSSRPWAAAPAASHLAIESFVAGDRESIDRAIATCRQAVEAARGSNTLARGMTLNALSKAYTAAGDLSAARELVEGALEIVNAAGHGNAISRLSLEAAGIAIRTGDLEDAWRHAERTVEFARASGDMQLAIGGTNLLAGVATRRGDRRGARELWVSILDDAAESLTQEDLGALHHAIAWSAVLDVDREVAEVHSARALELAAGDGPLAARVLYTAGEAARTSGDLERAWNMHLRAGRHRHAASVLPDVIEGLAGVRVEVGDAAGAVMLLGSAAAHRPEGGARRVPGPGWDLPDAAPDAERDIADAITGRARAALGDGAFDAAWNRGSTIGLAEALALAEDMGPP